MFPAHFTVNKLGEQSNICNFRGLCHKLIIHKLSGFRNSKIVSSHTFAIICPTLNEISVNISPIKDTDGKGLSDQEIYDEVDTFMFEGHDTTAAGISWFLYNMARFPEFQQKCREEVDDLVADRECDQLAW